ncbi:MAG: hypothetical protein JNL86_07900 [Nitrospira sp.]|nr:hypothetical protein [Nitrospira sp.]MCC7473546.1 hypothetical protein [Candidatus Nomurabacteria bacterium]
MTVSSSIRLAYVSLLLGGSLLGCSQSSDVLSNNLNACLIVTEADVELAIGTPVTPGLRQNDRQCLYQAKRNPQETVTVELNQGPDGDKKSLFQDQRNKAGNQPVPGVGDGAFTLKSPIGGIQLTFLKADALVTLSLTSPKQANPQAAVTNLAKVAATRLGSPIRSAAAAEPGITGTPSQWAGDWYGCMPVGLMYGKGHLVLTDRGTWTLTTAVVMAGTVTAGRGRWEAESYPEILHGTYQLAGADRFSTTGILSVSWDKLPKNQPPSKFDPILWQSFTAVPHKVAVKRLPPVEPSLVGTWEGSVKFVDHQEEFIWTITAANVSEFYKATSQTGRIEQEQDRFRLVVTQGKTAPLSVRVVSQEKMELTDTSGTVSQWNRNEKLLSRC